MCRTPRSPHNPLIAEPLFLTGYIEHAGTGTLDMIALCGEAKLPPPDFRHDDGQFVLTLWRDALTSRVLDGLTLNPRQRQAILYVRTKERITNAEYRTLTGAIKKTASRDLDDLVGKNVFARLGTTGRGTAYTLATKRDMKETKGTRAISRKNGDIKGTKGTRRISRPKR